MAVGRSGIGLGLVLASAFAVGACNQEPPLATVGSVDLQRFQGQWFEIAHLPRPTQVNCTGTTANYALTSPTTLTLVHQCNVGSLDGPLRQVVANAVVKDPSATAKLAVDFGGIYGDYWIIDLGAQYEYAVVGHPSRDYLWILSRSPKLDAMTLEGVKNRAQDSGFDVSRLEYTTQPDTAPPASDVNPAQTATPPKYGCAAAGVGRAAPRGGPIGLLAAVGLCAFLRRRHRHAHDASCPPHAGHCSKSQPVA
jgi:apolipoprotein D and lipocalin family protein